MKNVGLLALRLVVGTLLAGHGSQKLFGWFGGPGLKGTHGFVEQLGMKPGKVWGTMAAVGETMGGVLTVLGFLFPLGPIHIASVMSVAIRSAHWNKPIWNQAGGAELPLTNFTVAAALAMTGPGRYSVDRLFGIRLPRWISGLAMLSAAAMTWTALQRPEVVTSMLDKASDVLPMSFSSTSEPDLEVETRPSSQESAQQTSV